MDSIDLYQIGNNIAIQTNSPIISNIIENKYKTIFIEEPFNILLIPNISIEELKSDSDLMNVATFNIKTIEYTIPKIPTRKGPLPLSSKSPGQILQRAAISPSQRPISSAIKPISS